ncbi:MAG: hypothetical protein ACR2IF_14630 [Terriglobales bacterium]
MRVRDLLAVLSQHDPESQVVWDARSEAFLIVGTRSGMHQEWPQEQALRLSREDRSFLGEMHIKDA